MLSKACCLSTEAFFVTDISILDILAYSTQLRASCWKWKVLRKTTFTKLKGRTAQFYFRLASFKRRINCSHMLPKPQSKLSVMLNKPCIALSDRSHFLWLIFQGEVSSVENHYILMFVYSG